LRKDSFGGSVDRRRHGVLGACLFQRRIILQKMVDGLGFALVSTIAFVGLHLIFAHPLRAFGVRQLGPGGFQLAYSLLATAGLFVVLLAYHGAPRGPALWPAGHAPIHVAFALAG
jgi:hypothetical protein